MLKNISFFLKIIAFFLLVFIWVYTWITYAKLPETVPVHFGIGGKADGFGPKSMNWLLVGISTLMYVFVFYLSRNPQSIFLNLPNRIKENRELTGIIVDVLNVLTMAIFAVITYESIRVSLHEMDGLSPISDYVLGLVALFVVGILIYSQLLLKKKSID
ncbi:DUF1648 domain-containing protein [Chryseobacterium sp. R2A-55]|uniref:DUF1648 domain-containing protein n=1 Tax=Chryseobacterium sp. R2A-55 TaxID=2744445 RepID=UPI001F286715|nr:DUF1648 domain-containing protein [Chryseobacterium sp. R2A-55]